MGLKLLLRPGGVEASLWRRFREGQSARRAELFNSYISLARAIARGEYRRRPAYGLERAEFEQLAFTGLLEAIDRYNPMHGAPFAAFARPRIKGAISDGLARANEAGAQYAHAQRVKADRLDSLQDGAPQDDPLEALAQLTAGLALGFLAQSLPEEDLAAVGLGAYESLAWRDLRLSIGRAIEELPELEKAVLTQHYTNGLPFSQIADLLNLSKGRISQIHRAALMRLRERLRHLD